MVEDIPAEELDREFTKQMTKQLLMEGLILEMVLPNGQVGYWPTEEGRERAKKWEMEGKPL